KDAAIPDVQTSELHVISSAVTPLWQRLKTTEATRLRVVTVTAVDGQHIVGVQIPGERVGAGSLALMPAFCDLRFGSATQRPTSFSDHKVFVAAPRCPSNDAILCEYQINSSRKDAKHH